MKIQQNREVKKKSVLHVGPDLSSQGGIAAVLNSYADHRALFEEFDYQLSFAGSCGRRDLGQIWQFATVWARVVQGALSGQYDIVHIHTSIRGSLLRKWLLAMTCLISRTKYIVHIHSGAVATYVDRASRLKKAAIWLMFRRAAEVVCISHAMQKWMLERGHLRPGRGVLIYNGIPTPATEDVCRKESCEEVVIIYLGKFSREKGIPVLIAAIDDLRKSGYRFKLFLGGNGDVESVLADIEKRDLCADVKYLGWVSGSEKSNLLSSADIFVLPSQSEGFPVSLVEAMAYGAAVVSTDIPGVTDAIRNEVEGLLIEYGDSLALSHALSRLIDDVSLRKRLSVSARERFLHKFTISNTICDLISMYNGVS